MKVSSQGLVVVAIDALSVSEVTFSNTISAIYIISDIIVSSGTITAALPTQIVYLRRTEFSPF